MASSDYFPGEDFNFETTNPTLELQNQASGSSNSNTLHEPSCSPATIRNPPGTQTTLPFSANSSKDKEKGKILLYNNKIIEFLSICTFTNNSQPF